jgi:hypothetical protein
MYHHFKGEPDLVPAAIRRTAEERRATAEGVLGGPGSPYQRIEAYPLRELDVLRGCPVSRSAGQPVGRSAGQLTMDPDVAPGRDRLPSRWHSAPRAGRHLDRSADPVVHRQAAGAGCRPAFDDPSRAHHATDRRVPYLPRRRRPRLEVALGAEPVGRVLTRNPVKAFGVEWR